MRCYEDKTVIYISEQSGAAVAVLIPVGVMYTTAVP